MTVFQPGDRAFHRGRLRFGTVASYLTRSGEVSFLFDDYTIPSMIPASHLEPAGEPMSTTFKSSSQASDSRTLSVDRLYGDPRLLISGENRIGFMIDPSDAPALALAILEAAHGSPLAPEVARAMEALEEYKQRIQIAAKEAADREKLEAEAWELYKARTNGSTFDSFHDLERGTQAEWIAVAKHARTMHGVTK